MGAHNFEHFERGTDPEKCYQRAVSDALHEHGHDAYNGSISTTGGWRWHQRNPVTLDQAYEIASSARDQYSKWEDCGAIPIQKASELDTREVQCEVYLPGPGDFWDRKKEVDALVKATVKLKKGEEVISWEVERPTHSWNGSASVKSGRDVEVTRKVTVEATEGKTETRYVVMGPGINLRLWDQMHKTQAAARASLKAWLDAGHGQSVAAPDPDYPNQPRNEYEVVGITRRISGEPVVRGYAEVVKTCYPIKAKVGKVNRTGEIEGFLFFGWAAC